MPSKLRKHLRGFTCSRQGHSQRLLELHTYLQHICHANYQCRKKSGEKGEGRSTSRQPREGRRNRVGKKRVGGWLSWQHLHQQTPRIQFAVGKKKGTNLSLDVSAQWAVGPSNRRKFFRSQ
uniref:Uncharacterized protein n=1 Tax=Oryza glumipatula TaxID=40148 RepID=A0A0D9YEY0_9ORYZ